MATISTLLPYVIVATGVISLIQQDVLNRSFFFACMLARRFSWFLCVTQTYQF